MLPSGALNRFATLALYDNSVIVGPAGPAQDRGYDRDKSTIDRRFGRNLGARLQLNACGVLRVW
jgi:hypothetical protein